MTPDSENPGLERLRHELRAAGVKQPSANPLRSGVHTRGYLPHVKREGAEYFVTFRLGDSLPKEVLIRYEAERAQRLRALHEAKRSGKASDDKKDLINRDFSRKIERYLDQGAGACHLRRPEIADLVVGVLRFFHEQRYLLGRDAQSRSRFVLSNAELRGRGDRKELETVQLQTCQALAGSSQRKILATEPFDHWVRDDEEHARIARYIRNNPVTARICGRPEDWRWGSAWSAKS